MEANVERDPVHTEDDFITTGMFDESEFLDGSLNWFNLDASEKNRLLRDIFQIEEREERVENIREISGRGNIVHGYTLTTLQQANISIHSLLEEERIFADATDWPIIFPVRHYVTTRNKFTLDMLKDSVLKGCKIKIITSRTRENPQESCLELSQILLAPSKSADEEEWNGVVHTFDLVEGGRLQPDCDKQETVEWKVVESPTLRWVCSQPIERFTDLQLVLLKYGIPSNPMMRNTLHPRAQSRKHVIISGESGTGKTTVVKRLVKLFLDLRLTPPTIDNIVVSVDFKDIIKFLPSEFHLDRLLLVKAIIASVRQLRSFKSHDCSYLYEKLMTNVVSPGMYTDLVYLLLDGLDHVGYDNLDRSFQVLELIDRTFPNVSLCVTTRPHLVHRLEAVLKTFAYNLGEMARPDEFYRYLGGHGVDIDHSGSRFFQTPIGMKVLKEVAGSEGGSSARCQPNIYTAIISEKYKVDCIKSFIDIKIDEYEKTFQTDSFPNVSKKAVILAGLRYYAVEVMCPSFATCSAFSPTVLGGITKGQLEEVGLVPFPANTCLCHGIIAEFVLAQILDELSNKWDVKEAFELFATFIKAYYLLDVDKLNVFDPNSVLNNFQLQTKLHFYNVFDLLENFWANNPSSSHGSSSSPPFKDFLKDVLSVATFHGHQRMFKYFFDATSEYRELMDTRKCIEFVVATEWFDSNWFKLITSRQFPNLDIQVLVNMLEFHNTTQPGIFWNSSSVYQQLFEHDVMHHHSHRIAASILVGLHISISNPAFTLESSNDQLKLFNLIANSENLQTIWEAMPIPKLLLTLNPACANGIYCTNHWTTLKFLLHMEVDPMHFFHQNPIFQDLYRLVSKLPDSLLDIGKGKLMETVKHGLEAHILEGEWVHECKKWYADIYDQVLENMYQVWLRRHEDWWAEDESMSKNNFLRICASCAFDYRFPKGKVLFNLGVLNGFEEEEEEEEQQQKKEELEEEEEKVLKKIGLIKQVEGTSTKASLFHETVADYLIAWAIANAGFSVDAKDFKDFLINSVLSIEHSEGEVMGKGNTTRLKHFFICYFLDKLTDVYSHVGDILERGTKECLQGTSSPSKVIPGIEEILQACYDSTHYNLLNLFARPSYQDIFTQQVPCTKLLFAILENISRPLVNIAVALIKSARMLGWLNTARNEGGETICQVAYRTCQGKPFDKDIWECFPDIEKQESLCKLLPELKLA